MKFRILIPLCLFWMFGLPLYAQNAQWVDVTGEWPVTNISPEEAFAKAKQLARREAIRQVLGEHIRSEILVKDYRMGGEFIHSFSYGHILQEQLQRVDIRVIARRPDQLPDLTCVVNMRCLVKEEKEQPDPGFRLRLSLNQTTFRAGEELIIRIQSTQDCYITVFNITASDEVIVLFPNLAVSDNFLPAHQEIVIPSDEQRQRRFNFTVHPLPGHQQDTEYIQVIATRQPMPFWETLSGSNGFKTFRNDTSSLMELAQWLAMIPVSQRTDAIASYVVVAQ